MEEIGGTIMDKKRVLYYNIDDSLDYENSLLKEWGIDSLELVEIKDREGKKAFY